MDALTCLRKKRGKVRKILFYVCCYLYLLLIKVVSASSINLRTVDTPYQWKNLACKTGVFVVVVVFFFLLSGRKLFVCFLNTVATNFDFITWENWEECKYQPLG